RGGNGQDTLTSGNGDDVLIGGLGQDVLTATAGDDLVLGGDLDSLTWNNAALDALATQWSGAQNTAQEVAVATALADAEVDTLSGGSGPDWFFGSGNGEGDPLDF